MADKLRPDELAAFKAAFDMFDKNQDGTISTKVISSRSFARKEQQLVTKRLVFNKRNFLCLTERFQQLLFKRKQRHNDVTILGTKKMWLKLPEGSSS